MARARPNPSAYPSPEPTPKPTEVVAGLGRPAQGPSPARQQMQRIEAAFAENTLLTEPRYPGYLRFGILLGGSVGLWACLIAGVFRLSQR